MGFRGRVLTVTKVSQPPAAAPAAMLVVVDALFMLFCDLSDQMASALLFPNEVIQCMSLSLRMYISINHQIDSTKAHSSHLCTRHLHRPACRAPDVRLQKSQQRTTSVLVTKAHKALVLTDIEHCAYTTRTMAERRPCCCCSSGDEVTSHVSRMRRRRRRWKSGRLWVG